MHWIEILTVEAAQGIAKLVRDGVVREFPYQPGHVVMSPDDRQLPRQLHQAFYGCYDWHSAVHSHWAMLVLLEYKPEMTGHQDMLAIMHRHMSAEALLGELAYCKEPGRSGFERPYGWAWIWKLSAQLAESRIPEAQTWHANIRPLAELLSERFMSWLDKQVYPCRAGTHGNTAFAMELGLDYARSCNAPEFGAVLSDAAVRLYGDDRGFTLRMEPSCNDFISPLLAEISLMGRVMPHQIWRTWLETLVPHDEVADLQPVAVTDRADGQGVHLDGLNLSRARHLATIARLTTDLSLRGRLEASAQAHWQAGMRHVFSGNFLGEHWLGTFALLAAQELAVNSMD
jgi:hypothetical protein